MLSKLQTLGLAEKEAKVYLSSLELGQATVQTIASKAGVNRATTYVIIESLTAKGLVASFEQGKKRYFATTHPSQLLRLIHQRELEINQLKTVLEKDLLPSLLAIHNIAGDKPKVKFFEGKEGIEAMHNELPKKQDSCVKTSSLSTEIIICNNKIGFTSLDKERPIGILVQDKKIADTLIEIIKKARV